jgi:hypothetical protein
MFPSLHPNALRRTHHNQQDNRGKGQQMSTCYDLPEPTNESGHTFATTDDLIAFVEDLDGYGLTVSDSGLLAKSIKHDAPGTDQPKIIVEARKASR